MAARKLQSEIDRTLKKVSEGVELFEAIYEKMQASTNQTQKEKLELDLKTQIKKLQRLRDQIKTWLASNDIKDKSALVENRRLIETQMEKFKACEKEMKTKAFSKEGLIQAARLDPKEQEKEDAAQWLQSQVEELQMQVEAAEAEIEALQGTSGKKRGKANTTQVRLDELDSLNERRKWHMGRLEIVLRLLQNGTMPPERCMSLKEDVQYFVESNTEEDFEEDEGIYDELNLDEEEEKFNGRFGPEDDNEDGSDSDTNDLPPPPPPPQRSKKQAKQHDDDDSSKAQESPVLKKATPARKQSVDTKPPPNINFAANSMSSIVSRNLPNAPQSSAPASAPAPRQPAQLPPIRYSAAAAAAVAPTTPAAAHTTTPSQPAPPPSAPPTQVTHPPPPPSTSSTSNQQEAPSSPSLTHLSTTSPMLSSAASVSHQPDGSMYSAQDSPAISEAVPSSIGQGAAASPQRATKDVVSPPRGVAVPSPSAAHALAAPEAQLPQVNGSTQPAPSGPSPLPQQVQQYNAGTPSTASASQPQPQYPPGVKVPPTDPNALAQQQQQRPGSAAQRPPGPLQDLVANFENVKKQAPLRMSNTDQVHKLLDQGLANVPEPHEMEKPKYYVPRNPFAVPAYYPQSPNSFLNHPGLYSTFEVETLFFIFYYLPGTYQQFLAAKELKRQSWRFHIKYMTWFQRHSEPQAITEEYEQGVYVYFDWEGSWCQRKKSDFRFEYRYLSED